MVLAGPEVPGVQSRPKIKDLKLEPMIMGPYKQAIGYSSPLVRLHQFDLQGHAVPWVPKIRKNNIHYYPKHDLFYFKTSQANLDSEDLQEINLGAEVSLDQNIS